jgi:hypothetical protein
MENLGSWLAWLENGAVWLQAVWFLVACAIGIPWIVRDEFRLRRTAPKPTDVAGYADRVEGTHGRESLSIVGQAMTDAREHGDFQNLRFLREVSGELVERVHSRASVWEDDASRVLPQTCQETISKH